MSAPSLRRAVGGLRRRRRGRRDQRGAALIAGLSVWLLVGGVVMAALLQMTLSASRVASIGVERAQEVRALDGALETAVVVVQTDPSGRRAMPSDDADGSCLSELGTANAGLAYDDSLGNTVTVTSSCSGPTEADEPRRVELTATLDDPAAPDRMTATAVLEVVDVSGVGSEVTVLEWNLASPQVLPGDTTTTTAVPTTTTAPTTTTPTTTSTIPGGITWEARVTAEWQSGMCVQVVVTNEGATNSEWKVAVDVKANVYTSWSGNFERSGDTLTVTGLSWNRELRPGASTNFGWCSSF